MIIETNSSEETFELGCQLACKMKPGEVYTLIGDLGVGKTVFTQGVAKGLQIEEPINSPTFTIIQEYVDGIMPFYHFDVYRIGDVAEMDEIGYDDYIHGDGVCLIDWENLIVAILPKSYPEIIIKQALTHGFAHIKITITNRAIVIDNER